MSYGDLPDQYSGREDARICILPVPFDMTSTWVKGADKGPEAIIEASANMELYDIETDSQVYFRGIFTHESVLEKHSVEKMVKDVRKCVSSQLQSGKFTVVIGGEHSVSIGAIQAHAECFGSDITVLQLDAHADLRQSYEGSKYNHACVMARAAEAAEVVQVGIRSGDADEFRAADRQRTILAQEIYKDKTRLLKALNMLTEKVYVTIDLDVFDPSIMPSTGTPEPGGLGWYETLDFLRMVFERKNVVGFDVVELCPNDNNKAPDFLAAKLIYKLLSYKFEG